MLHLIPTPKTLVEIPVLLKKKKLSLASKIPDSRLQKASQKLPLQSDGIPLYITYGDKATEGYTLTLTNEKAEIIGDSAVGAFYGARSAGSIPGGFQPAHHVGKVCAKRRPHHFAGVDSGASRSGRWYAHRAVLRGAGGANAGKMMIQPTVE